MTKITVSALVALTVLAGAASASLQGAVDAYGVDLNVASLSTTERAAVQLAVSSSDSTSDVVRTLKSFAK